MQYVIVLALIALLATPASAQIVTPSQTAIQIDTVINQWAQVIEAQQKQIEELKKDNTELKAKLEAEKK